MAEKIKQIKSGFHHTLILTQTGKVYELGDIKSCELGKYYDIQSNIHKSKPCLIDSKYFDHEKIIQITTGSYHSMALSQKGNVYSWGSNDYKQLGHKHIRENDVPQKINLNDSVISQIDATEFSSFVLDQNNNLYSWGENEEWNLGLGLNCETYVSTPRLISKKDYNNEKIIKLCCGNEHTLLLTQEGKVYSCGVPVYQSSRFEINHEFCQSTFKHISKSINHLKEDELAFGGEKIIDVEASDCSFALTQSGKLYIWGFNGRNDFGICDRELKLLPRMINPSYLPNEKISKIVSCMSKSFFKTIDNQFYAYGENSRGHLCVEKQNNVNKLEKINLKKYFKNQRIESFSASIGTYDYDDPCLNRLFAITQSGKAFSWGDNIYGHLGVNQKNNTPQLFFPETFGNQQSQNKKIYNNSSFEDVCFEF